MARKRDAYFVIFTQIFAGMGIGILMGLIIGLSVSPVVKTILGTLSGLLGVFLGLQGSIFDKKGQSNDAFNPVILSSLRAGSFGLFCALTILYSLYLRTNDVLGMTVTEQVSKWTEAGYDPDLARELALYEKINLTSKQLLTLHERKSTNAGKDDSEQVAHAGGTGGAAGTFLFSFKDLPRLSQILDPTLYDSNPKITLENYSYSGVPELEQYASSVQNFIAPEDQLPLLTHVTTLAVALSDNQEDYLDLNEKMRSISGLKSWPGLPKYPAMKDVITLVEKNVPVEKHNEIMKVIGDVLFNIEFAEN